LVAAALAAVGTAVLGAKGVRTFGPDPFGTLEPWAGAVVLVVAVVGAASAGLAPRAPRAAGTLAATATIGAVLADLLPTAPPRYLAVLPLAATTVLLLAPGTAPDAGTAYRPARHRGFPAWAVAVGWVGIVLHLLVGFPFLVSGLVAPGYGVIALWVVWAVLLAVALRVRARRPVWTPAVPVAAFGLWQGAIAAGGAWLGWQA
jgi:hypothetical protein